MKNSEKNSFEGLPLALVKEILGKSGQIADDIFAPFHEINSNRDKLREQLREHNIIQNNPTSDSEESLTSCGIDGYYTVEKFLTSNLACSVAFAVEGLIPPSGEKHWETPSHKAIFHTEKQYSETAKILSAIMMEMEIELAAKAPHDIIFLNGSFITPFITFMETIRLALVTKESITSQEFIKRIKPSILSFKNIFDSPNSDKMWVGIPKNTSNRELVNKLSWSQQCDDNILFTLLLSPGEYTAPIPVEQSELSRVRDIPIKDENFATVRDRIVSAIGKLHVMYYRPHSWTPVLRIEIDSSVSQDSSRLTGLLNTIKFQCGSAGITEPYPVYCADNLVKYMDRAIPSLRKSATSQITNLHKNDLGEIFPLIMFKDRNLE